MMLRYIVAGMADTTSTGVACRLLMAFDDGNASVPFAAQLYIEHHQVVALTRNGCLGIVAAEPLVHFDAGPRGFDPRTQLIAGRQIVLDDGDFGHAVLHFLSMQEVSTVLPQKSQNPL
jgi:hypothetical protein